MKFTEKQASNWAADISRGDTQCPYVRLTLAGHECCTWKAGHPMPHEPSRDCEQAEIERMEWTKPVSVK